MVLELHVWGPAFGLSSIDPECIAAIAYCAYVLPRHDWVLIPSNDTSVSSDHILPALHDGRGTWTSGYSGIVSHIAGHSRAPLPSSSPTSAHSSTIDVDDIDHDLVPLQRADALACASYLTTRGSALLAMSLYVSPTAWARLTRPAYSSLLPFPLTWTVPPALRHAAIERVEHLGLGHLAAGVDSEDASTSAGADAATTTATGFLRLPPRLGPAAALDPEQASAIRLQALAADFFAVLDGLRGGRCFLLRDARPCSLDFLAYGYLKLMQVQTPHPFLDTVLTRSHRGLLDFIREMEAVLPPSATASPGSTAAGEEGHLPWRTPAPTGAAGILGRFADGVVEAIPGVGEGWKSWRRGGEGGEAGDPVQLALTVGGALTGLAALGGGLLLRSLSPLGAGVHRFEPEREDKGGLHRFGDVGAMLQGLPPLSPMGDSL